MDNKVSICFPASSEYERFARTVAAAFAIPLDPTVEELDEIKIAVSEAVTNAIIHGYCGADGIIELNAELDGRELTFIIRDMGNGIADIDKAREPLYSGSSDPERSGMGFSIMEAFTDELTVTSTLGEGTTVVMRKRLADHAG
ncbi:MAG: anti-sigma F factor [Clostridia bacterium]|nr:anti-sigma F factor [Clostridia bacterium]